MKTVIITLTTLISACGWSTDYAAVKTVSRPAKGPDSLQMYMTGEYPPGKVAIIGSISAEKRNVLCSQEQSITEMKKQAAERGADGLMDVDCATPGTVGHDNCACASKAFVYQW